MHAIANGGIDARPLQITLPLRSCYLSQMAI